MDWYDDVWPPVTRPGEGDIVTHDPIPEPRPPVTVPPPNEPVALPSVPVALRDWRPRNQTEQAFVAELHLAVSESAQYRVIDAAGAALSDWQTFGPGAATIVTNRPIPRSIDNEYELIVERKKPDSSVKQFRVPFALKSSR